MTDSQLIVYFLVGGAVNATVLAVIAFLLSRFVRDIAGRYLLVIFLFIAGGAYVRFAVGAGVSPIWVLAELVHVVIFGTVGLLGLRGHRIGLLQDGRHIPSGTSRFTT
jgi:hypothetical protein